MGPEYQCNISYDKEMATDAMWRILLLVGAVVAIRVDRGEFFVNSCISFRNFAFVFDFDLQL